MTTSDKPRKPGEVLVLLRNKKARHDYFVEETLEAGIALLGSEVKSLRASEASMSDAYASVVNGSIFLQQMQINEYKQANRYNHEPKRERRLLLHRKEIEKLASAVNEKGYTLLPLEVYIKDGRIKVMLGLCKGKKMYDKREVSRERDARRDMDRARKGGE